MSNTMKILVGLLLPLSGTVLGAAMVFFLKREMSPRLQKVLLGFAGSVMIAASVWSLLIPAIEMAEAGGRVAWLPAVVGFLLGIAFLLLLDSVIPHMHLGDEHPEGRQSKLGKSLMLVLAVTLHNIPEGMGSRCGFCGDARGQRDDLGSRSIRACDRHCNSEFSRGGGHYHAAARAGHEQKAGLRLRRAVRRGRTAWRTADDSVDNTDSADSTLHSFVCSRCDDLCCR